ncbi:MAG: fumarate hydratase [Anaerosomatales bacterium]|nr:fumarate hydratase [Anaerosomatales bacterium]
MVGAEAIGSAVYDAIVRAATTLRPDALAAMRDAEARERSPRGRAILGQLLENARIAADDAVPLCQDTGSVWVLLEVGEGECVGGDVPDAVNAAVAAAYADAHLRMSIVRDALMDRANTKDNTPAFIDIGFRSGTGVTVTVMLKGGGSDNASAVSMLAPGDGEDGVVRFVTETVARTGASACPPLLVGVGVGATFDKVASLAKRALLRPIGTAHRDPRVAALERRIAAKVDALGIGPGGLGGTVTALGVHVVTAPCHIASLPVAVNVGCSAVRSASVEVA